MTREKPTLRRRVFAAMCRRGWHHWKLMIRKRKDGSTYGQQRCAHCKLFGKVIGKRQEQEV